LKKNLFSVLLIVLIFALVTASLFASAEQTARNTVAQEIKAALSGKSEFARKVGHYSDFYRELLKVLKKSSEPGLAKPLLLNGKVVKILVPLNMSSEKVGGFFQISADGRKILSYLPWTSSFEPLFIIDRQKWEKAASADQLEELKELVPLKEGYSAGVPVEKSDLTDLFLIDYIDQLPCKTQEEREEYTSKNGLKASLGRRTGSSKCLSYSASLSSDWWNIAQGNKIGKYDSFVNGAREYGMNPRVVESLYFSQPKCPYAFVKETGLDRVTGEKIPYSPKNYAFIMSSLKTPPQVRDPLKKNIVHDLPANGFGMDLPYDNSFNKCNGKIEKIREDLKKYGIMYAQHTSRLFKDKVSLTLQGVHAVNIVGTAKLKGEPVVIYYETFGKNHRDYLEDSFYGPALRAFPVKFFYQGIVFPHRIMAEVETGRNGATVSFKTAAGKKLAPEKLQIFLNGKEIKTKAAARIEIPLSAGLNHLTLKFARKYFYTPEEPDGYTRNYLIKDGKIFETAHFEAVLRSYAERKAGLFKKVFGKSDSYTDYLKARAENLSSQFKKQLSALRNDTVMIKALSEQVARSKVLASSDLADLLKEIRKFHKIND
jgi:hypothetical protein